jgi:tetratricopeptide (TPR) repeat protein
MQRKALALNEVLNRKEGMAIVYGNLGIIHEIRGELDQAEEMQRKALKLYHELRNKEGMAASYSNLGLIHGIRGEFEQAEEMHCKSLKLEEELGNKKGMAAAYFNLGGIGKSRGNQTSMCQYWHQARELYHKMGLPNEVAKVEKSLKAEGCGDS